jgi:hypothetical protein
MRYPLRPFLLKHALLLGTLLQAFPLFAQTSLTVTSPNGGETWSYGEVHTITWIPENVRRVDILLLRNGVLVQSIVNNLANADHYDWTVNAPPGTGYTIRVRSTDKTVQDVSDAPFQISGLPIRLTANDPITPGGTFRVTVNVGTPESPATDLFGVSFKLSYDPTYLTVVEHVPWTFLGTDVLYSGIDAPQAGEIGIAISRKDGQGASTAAAQWPRSSSASTPPPRTAPRSTSPSPAWWR